MKKLLTLILPAALCGSFAAAQQIGCQATTSSVSGSYAYVATELPWAGLAVTPPGTTSNQQVFSTTPTGKLVGGINGGGAFSLAGVLYFDGAGNISVATSSATLGAATKIGTYSVNTDCTINATLTDVFNTAPTAVGNSVPTLGTASLIGVVQAGGSGIILSAPQSSTSTNGNTPVVPGEFGSRLTIQLVRTFTSGCSAANLTGAYSLMANGFALVNTSSSGTATSGTAQPLMFIARLRFDGNGNIVADTVASPSPLASFQYMGTYTVNLDCSGTMTLSPVTSSSATSTTPAPSVTLNFVLVPSSVYLMNGFCPTGLSGNATRPSFEFTTMNSIESLMGTGIAQ